jgi:hypothetical protein
MEIDAVGTHGGIVRLNAVAEQARQLAVARQTEILQDQGVAVPAPNTPVINNPSFSPAIYAQAAQYQLYTQTGALASMAQQNHGPPPTHKPDSTDVVTAVEPSEGGSVDTHL